MNQILKKIYEDKNYPAFLKFYKFVKAEHPLFKKIDIKIELYLINEIITN